MADASAKYHKSTIGNDDINDNNSSSFKENTGYNLNNNLKAFNADDDNSVNLHN